VRSQTLLEAPAETHQRDELAARGYIEEEWFVTGASDAFDPDGIRIASDVPYTTRFLVRRPSDPVRSSGVAFLDPLHMIGEMPASWDVADWLMRNGHVWIGVSVHNSSFGRIYGFVGGIDALKEQDPERYAKLELANFERPPRLRSYQGPNTDSFALKWTMAMAHPQGPPIVIDVADQLRAGAPFRELKIRRIYGCGVSQTANFWRLFLDAGWHDRGRAEDGSPPLDAYVLIVSAAPDYRPADAVLVNVLSEAEVVGTIVPMALNAPPDRDFPRVRGIELPGASHTVGHAEVKKPGEGHRHTSEPYLPLIKAVLHGVDRWVRDDIAMPHVARIARDPASVDGVVRDEHGNAVGGVRVPWLEAPKAQYLPRCSCGPTLGETVCFSNEKVTRLYSTDAEHERLWRRAVDRLVEDRLLLEEDVELLMTHRHTNAV
jgi:hypothetical protein